jgi:hypothetical protein
MRSPLAAAIVVCAAAVAVASRQSAPADETPSQFYLRYRAEVPAATALSQIVAFWSAAQRSEFNAAPAAERPELNEIKAMFRTVSGIKISKASATATSATLEVEGTMDSKAVKAIVQLLHESDGWKVASGPENWR